MNGTLGVIFVSARVPKKTHNAIAYVISDYPVKAMNGA